MHAWMARGWVACCLNQPGQAIDALTRAVRLSPLDPLGYFFRGGLALGYLAAGQYEQALEWADACCLEYPRYYLALRVKVVLLHSPWTSRGSTEWGQAIT